MPLTVAPPPRNGDAAQGRWFSDPSALPASDQADAHHEGPEPTPTLPAPAAIARTMAAGVLLSTAALAIPATLVFMVAAVRLTSAGDTRLTFDGAAPVLLAVAFGLGCAATLATPAWPWPARRPRTLALAAIVSAASPLSGHVLPAIALTIVAVSLALVRDHRTPGGRRVTHWGVAAALGSTALAVAIAGVALAESHPLHPTAPRSATGERTTPAPATHRQTPAKPHGHETPPAEQGSTDGKTAPPTDGKTTPPSHGTTTTPTDGKTAPPTDGKATPPTDGKTTPPTHGTTTPPTDGKAAPPTDGKATPPTHGTTTTPADGKAAPPTEGTTAPPTHGDAPPATDPDPTAPAERGSAEPGATPAIDGAAATAFVRDYYAALDERRYADAWAVLSPAVQRRFGGFARWKAGYARTTKSEPRDLTTRVDGEALVVNVRLVAHEKNCDALQTFRVTWRLEQNAGGWHVAGLQGIALGGRPCE